MGLSACIPSGTAITVVEEIPLNGANDSSFADTSSVFAEPQSPYDDMSDGEGNLDVGSIAGNPSGKPVRQLILRTVTKSSETLAAHDESAGEEGIREKTGAQSMASETNDTNDTTDAASDTVFSATSCDTDDSLVSRFAGMNLCAVTPSEYNLGVRDIAFASCASGNGAVVLCGATVATTAEPVLPLFANDVDDITRIEIDDLGVGFEVGTTSESLSALGGIIFTVAYIEQRLPDATTAPTEADKITPELQGRRYRVCTTDETFAGADMGAHCGNTQAHRGDILWDLDGNGTFGYLLADADGIFEVDERPAGKRYGLMNIDRRLRELDGSRPGYISSTQDLFFEFVAGFGALVDVSENGDFAAAVSIDVTDTFRFVDGAVHAAAICRESGKIVCTSMGNGDPVTPGRYDPRDDFFLPKAPAIRVMVE